MVDIKVEIKGLREVQKKAEQTVRDLRGEPMLKAMRDSTLMVTRDAKINLVAYQSPEVGGVDTGITRASITPEVRSSGDEIEGVVGSNRMSAVVQELGSRPHWPPISALEGWVKRHGGGSAFLVARAISRRGTPARHFLSRAFNSNKSKIQARFDKALKIIVSK